MEETKWYTVQTLSGKEHKVKEKILALFGNDERVKEVFIPQEDVIEMKNGQRVYKKKKLMPGYILIKLIPKGDIFTEIRKINGVVQFLGSRDNPTPLTEEEFRNIMERVNKSKESKKIEIKFKVGDKVRIIDGPFQNLVGVVKVIDEESEKVELEVPFLGRQAPVTVDVMQVEPLENI